MAGKLKKFVGKKQDSFLTILEKNWRDWFFKPLTKILFKLGITANQITILGFILLAAAIAGYFSRLDIKWQLLLLVLSALTDIIDGPRARNHNQVTALGTWLDHSRDGLLVLWGTFLIYEFEVLTIEWILITWALQGVMVWIIMKDFLIQILREPIESWQECCRHYSLNKLQTNVMGRLQFFCWMLGYGFLVLFIILPYPNILLVGKSLITLEIVFAAMNTFDVYSE